MKVLKPRLADLAGDDFGVGIPLQQLAGLGPSARAEIDDSRRRLGLVAREKLARGGGRGVLYPNMRLGDKQFTKA